jgi:molybdate transport system substrate-binding protein
LAENLVVGVAANFILPFKTMARVFEERTFIGVDPIFTSTGSLYAQIRNGAPYDLFLAADQVRPALLFRDGVVEKPFIYARGRLVLWTPDPALCKSGTTWKEVVSHASADRIGTANPETAPYGAASVEALKRTGLWEVVHPKLVYGQSIAQAFQYAHSRSVRVSFCALSSALSSRGKEGCYFNVKEAPAIIQAACIVRGRGIKEGARKFAAFLSSAEAEAIKRKYGYE